MNAKTLDALTVYNATQGKILKLYIVKLRKIATNARQRSFDVYQVESQATHYSTTRRNRLAPPSAIFGLRLISETKSELQHIMFTTLRCSFEYVNMRVSTTLLWSVLFLCLCLVDNSTATGDHGKFACVWSWQLKCTFVLILYAVNLEPFGVLQLCPGSNITFVCTMDTNQSHILYWQAFDQDNTNGDSYVYFIFSTVDMNQQSIGSFMLLLKSTSPLVSTATLTNGFNLDQNGTILVCASTNNSMSSPSQMKEAKLILNGT